MSDFPLWHSKRQQKRTIKGRFLGCLLGGAVGDALGAPVEFMRRSEILNTFGPDGITKFAPAYGGLGIITDDTQMTLFTAEGLLRAHHRYCARGMCSWSGVVASAYTRWLRTQGEQPSQEINRHWQSYDEGWLFQQQSLHKRRAPGNTCLSALKAMKTFGDPAHNDSKGCGGVMRVAPVGLMAWNKKRGSENARAAFDMGTELAALTHGHPTGALTGGVLAVLVLALTDGASLQEGLTTATALLKNRERHEETLRAIETAEEFAASTLPPHEAIAKLGQGWIAEEALAISIYCALVARSFQEGVILAVNHDGDSDSTGSITGNLLGAMYGVKAIPATWLEPLELHEIITDLAEDLFGVKCWPLQTWGHSAESWRKQYSQNKEFYDRFEQRYPSV